MEFCSSEFSFDVFKLCKVSGVDFVSTSSNVVKLLKSGGVVFGFGVVVVVIVHTRIGDGMFG